MSRRTWQAVIGGCVALLLVAALVVLLLLPEPTTEPDNPDPSTDTVTVDPLIDKATKDNSQAVSAVTVTTAKESFTVKPNAEGIYCVEAYADLPVDESAVDVLLDAVTTITPSSQMDAGGRLSAPLAGAVTVYVGWHGPRLPEVN